MNPTLFRIKICGITTPEDGLLAAAAGADAIGLNFYPGSPRCVTEAMAKTISHALPAGVAKVGVFVNMSSTNVTAIADLLELDWIQLHGDELPGAIAELAPRRVIRALPCGPGGLPAVVAYLKRCNELDALPAALLADAAAGGAYGGTGRTAAWSDLAPPREWLQDIPLILAGGLTAENVVEAVGAVLPQAVDTASGVETEPGRKHAPLLKAFVKAATESLGMNSGRP